MKYRLFLASMLTFGSFWLNVNANESAMPEAETKTVSYLRLPLAPLNSLDPSEAPQAASIEVSAQLFAPLIQLDPATYQPQPALATQWEISADGLEYTFKLRPDAVWNNGEPLSAADVVWTLRHNVSPASTVPNVQTLYILKNAQAIHQGEITDLTQLGVAALGPNTVLFTLEQPIAYFPVLASLWMFTPLPAIEVDRYGATWGQPDIPLVSSGPYQVEQWTADQNLILKQNPHYFAADQVSIPAIHYHFLNDIKSGQHWYERDELDVLGGQYLPLSNALTQSLFDSQSSLMDDYHTVPALCTEFYGFNIEQPPLNNSLVRKAIAAAVNKQLLIDVVLKHHQPAQTFVPPPLLGSVPPREDIGINFNKHKARTWLADAGYPEGEGFPPLTLMINEDVRHYKVAEAIQLFLKSYLNITLEIQQYPLAEYLKQLHDPQKPIHLFRMGWCGDYPDAHSWLYDAFHRPQIPLLTWHNETFQKIVRQAQTILDPQQREQAYWEAEYWLVENEAVILPLYFLTTGYLVKPRVNNWSAINFGGQPVTNWSLTEQH